MKEIIRSLAGVFIGTMLTCTGFIVLSIRDENSYWAPWIILVGVIILGISFVGLVDSPETKKNHNSYL